jgi:hypothetical protein
MHTRYRKWNFFNNFTTNEDIAKKLGALQTHTTDTFLISPTTNVPLLKFRCNIFIGVRIIKEIPGSVPSGTPVIVKTALLTFCYSKVFRPSKGHFRQYD